MRSFVVSGCSVVLLLLAAPACRMDASGLVEVDGGSVVSSRGRIDALAKEGGGTPAAESGRINTAVVQTDAAQVLKEMEDGLDGGAKTGLAPAVVDAAAGLGGVDRGAGAMDADRQTPDGGVDGSDASTAGVRIDGSGNTGDEPCVPVATNWGSQPFVLNTTDAVCIRRKGDVNGWLCSNFQGRTLTVNHVAMNCSDVPLPPKWNGYYYFDVSAGLYTFASVTWW